MKYSPLVDRIAGERSEAWSIHYAAVDAKRRGEDVIILSVGDPDLATPAVIPKPASPPSGPATRTIPTSPDDRRCRAAIAEDFRRDTGVPVTGANVIMMSGAQCALYCTAQVLCEPGTDVIVLDPMYLTYEATIRSTGATLVTAPQPAAADFAVDLDALARAITPKTRAIFFATPNNPTGHVMGEDEIEGIAALARKHDLWVVADEVYSTLTFERPHLSIAALPGMAERTATVSSLSKSHAMTGWRAGWVIGPTQLIDHVYNLSLAMLYGLPGFIQEAALVAITKAHGEAGEMRDIYRRRRDLVVHGLAGINSISCRHRRAACS